MSNALAIGAVSAVIKNLLENGFVQQGLGSALGQTPTITLLAPDVEAQNAGGQSTDRLNLFLYQTSFNVGWRNAGLPSRDSRGERVCNPPLALDLHYLITAYSREAFHAEVMLGYAMQMLHEIPMLSRERIRTTLAGLASSLNPVERAVATADLADQVEAIKFCPYALTTEELFKLWSAFQNSYRPSAAYEATVVLIDSQRRTRSALPVRDRNLVVLPFERPVIEAVEPQVVQAGAPLVIKGRNLRADITRISVGLDALIIPNPVNLSEKEIQVSLPAGLRAGINTVQVIHPIDFGTGGPHEPHRGFESNVVAFMLAPRLTNIATPLQVDPGGTLTLTVEPPIERQQRVTVLIGDRGIPFPARSPTGPETTDTLAVPIPADLPAGRYLLRVRVDGADSPLMVDTDTNAYVSPWLEVT